MKRLKKILLIFFISLLLLCAFPFLFSKSGKTFLISPKPFENSQFDTINNQLIHYRVFGSDTAGNNILLVHGFSGHTFSWRKCIDTLMKSNFRVLCVDLPPFGYSDKSDTINFSDSLRASILKTLCKKISDKRWFVAGHSMGAQIAGCLASKYPENFKGIIYVDGTYSPNFKAGWFAGAVFSNAVSKRYAEVISRWKLTDFETVHKILNSAYGRTADEKDAHAYSDPLQFLNTPSAILESVSYIGKGSDENIPSISSLVIWGEKDTWIDFEKGKEFSDRWRIPLFKIDSAGHCPMETHSQTFNKELIRFLNLHK